MNHDSKEDRLEKLLLLMERYFAELNECDHGQRPAPVPRAPSKEALRLIAEYSGRRERMAVPPFKDVTSLLARAAETSRERMRLTTSWAGERIRQTLPHQGRQIPYQPRS